MTKVGNGKYQNSLIKQIRAENQYYCNAAFKTGIIHHLSCHDITISKIYYDAKAVAPRDQDPDKWQKMNERTLYIDILPSFSIYIICLCVQLMWYVFMYHCHQLADVWGDGDLPPGWREISDSSEVYFWHIPTGTTQYHRPVAPGNQHASPSTEQNLCQETKESLKPPNEVTGPTDITQNSRSNVFIFNFP